MEEDNKKSAEEASNIFNKKIKASVSRVNPLDPNVRKLHLVTFDENNNPIEAKLVPLYSDKRHGLSSWDKKTFFTKWVYIDAFNKQEALSLAKDFAFKKLEKKK